MATLEKIRKKGGFLVAVVIGFALVAFIFTGFFTGMGRSTLGETEIGNVNGESIYYNDFQINLQEAEEFNKLRTGRNADSKVREQLRSQIWNQMVDEIIMGNKYQESGVAVTTAEIVDMATGKNVHPAIRQMFTDPNTGVFNKQAVINFIHNRKNNPNVKFYWDYLQKVLVKEKLQRKYTNLFQKGFYVTNGELDYISKAADRNVNFDFVAVNYQTIPDSIVSVSDSEIKKYYNNHKEEFKQDAERTIEYVTYVVTPSEEDDADAKKWIEDSKQEFSDSSVDPVLYVAQNSDVPFENKNLKEDELNVIVKDFVVNGKVGDVFGPYKDNNAYKLCRIIDIKQMPDSVRARHILIQEKDAKASNELADSLITVIKKGGDFAELARKYSKDKGSAVNGGDLNWFKEGVMVPQFNDAAFSTKKGGVVKVDTQYGTHIINIQDIGKKVTKYKLANLVRDVKYSSKTYQQVYAKVNKFAATNNTSDKFKEAIKKENLTPRFATIKKADSKVNNLKDSRQLVQWAYKSKLNDITSTIYEFDNTFVVAVVTGIVEDGYQDVNSKTVKTIIKSVLLKDKKAKIIEDKFVKNTASSQSLSSLAQKMNSTVKTANGVNFNSYQVAGAGFEPALIGLATSSEVGAISKPVQGNNGVYVVKVISEEKTGNDNKEQIKQQLNQTNLMNIQYQFINSIIDDAEITDLRIDYF